MTAGSNRITAAYVLFDGDVLSLPEHLIFGKKRIGGTALGMRKIRSFHHEPKPAKKAHGIFLFFPDNAAVKVAAIAANGAHLLASSSL